MPTSFDEVLCPTDYSAVADGGPEFATAIVSSGAGGSVSHRAETREDYQSKYEIMYGELDRARQLALRQFAILRKGMARGFRFLAPDHNELTLELTGWLNPATGDIEKLAQTDGSLTDFYLIKHYEDAANNYTRRIVKPSPFDDVTIRLAEVLATVPPTYGLIDEVVIAAGTNVQEDGSIAAQYVGTLDSTYDFTFDFTDGTIVFDTAPPIDHVVQVSCIYHLPVAFMEDWMRFRVDETTISEFRVGVTELLPIELGIT